MLHCNRRIGARERRQLIPHVRFQVPFLGPESQLKSGFACAGLLCTTLNPRPAQQMPSTLTVLFFPSNASWLSPGRSTRSVACFFFLWYGRSRSKARSLHENKLSSIKLQHGHRWSHANWQIIKTKKQNTPPKRQDADPPARFASHLPKDSEANSERLSQVLVHEPVFNARAGTLIRQQ